MRQRIVITALVAGALIAGALISRAAARLVPVAPAGSGRRTLGIDAGSVRILPGFDEMDEQIAHTFGQRQWP